LPEESFKTFTLTFNTSKNTLSRVFLIFSYRNHFNLDHLNEHSLLVPNYRPRCQLSYGLFKQIPRIPCKLSRSVRWIKQRNHYRNNCKTRCMWGWTTDGQWKKSESDNWREVQKVWAYRVDQPFCISHRYGTRPSSDIFASWELVRLSEDSIALLTASQWQKTRFVGGRTRPTSWSLYVIRDEWGSW